MSLTEKMEAIRKAIGVAQADLFNVRTLIEIGQFTPQQEQQLDYYLSIAQTQAESLTQQTGFVAQQLLK